jgi:hypothetical protein
LVVGGRGILYLFHVMDEKLVQRLQDAERGVKPAG